MIEFLMDDHFLLTCHAPLCALCRVTEGLFKSDEKKKRSSYLLVGGLITVPAGTGTLVPPTAETYLHVTPSSPWWQSDSDATMHDHCC